MLVESVEAGVRFRAYLVKGLGSKNPPPRRGGSVKKRIFDSAPILSMLFRIAYKPVWGYPTGVSH